MISDVLTKRPRHYNAGDYIMHQGDVGEYAYFIEEGQVEIVLQKQDGSSQIIGTRGPGTIIGEMAIIDNEPRTASVRATNTCKVLEISREDFHRRLSGSDAVLQTIMQVILTRYRDTLARIDTISEKRGFPSPEEIEREYVLEHNAVESIKIANEFKEALENGDLRLHYQPIIDLSTNDITGFEALMRWEHPDRGFVSPGVFIPIAEDTGLIVSASTWALNEACRALKRIENSTGWKDCLGMSVNFSSTDFASDDFVDNVYNTLSTTDVAAHQLTLEITERILMQQPENANKTLEMCRKAGMKIAIDDFGTGYSSLSYLHSFPIDILKIDRSFVVDMMKKESSLELVRSIIGLGQNLKMSIVAEGVEKKEEADTLKFLGCERAQGYYFAKPLPEEEIIALLKSWDNTKT
ncbi:MAG: EAL domain-containing protein [Rhodospirillales bacterium]|nr:EAL domain-containing protein [Rhodospirillales bacterium]MCB9972932.1 EAL domain-containing protein [Rhodospirillales bacterium]MCB9980130.1 EAL domain-containing protein [Rhodospirillales bacterium]